MENNESLPMDPALMLSEHDLSIFFAHFFLTNALFSRFPPLFLMVMAKISLSLN